LSDVLLLVDVVNSFRHEDGDRLAASFRARFPALRELVARARSAGVPVVYANDNWGIWDSDAPRLLVEAREGLAGDLVAEIAPREGDTIVVKPRYSAFKASPLRLILEELGTSRILLAGTATEMCVTQTAIDARDLGLKVSVVAEACSSVDERLETIALEYLERVVGTRVESVAEVLPSSAAA
jgi:nicotinamidase-related amidase